MKDNKEAWVINGAKQVSAAWDRDHVDAQGAVRPREPGPLEAKMVLKGWITNKDMPNQLLILEGDNAYVSYNPKSGKHKDPALEEMAELISSVANIIEGGHENGLEETALFDGKTWRILNGDFRKEYEAVAPQGIAACIAFYESKLEHRSDWSTDK